jgi:hypothetical protein
LGIIGTRLKAFVKLILTNASELKELHIVRASSLVFVKGVSEMISEESNKSIKNNFEN